jgi:hypothetical protein
MQLKEHLKMSKRELYYVMFNVVFKKIRKITDLFPFNNNISENLNLVIMLQVKSLTLEMK